MSGDNGTDHLVAGESRTFADPMDGFALGELVILDRYGWSSSR